MKRLENARIIALAKGTVISIPLENIYLAGVEVLLPVWNIDKH